MSGAIDQAELYSVSRVRRMTMRAYSKSCGVSNSFEFSPGKACVGTLRPFLPTTCDPWNKIRSEIECLATNSHSVTLRPSTITPSPNLLTALEYQDFFGTDLNCGVEVISGNAQTFDPIIHATEIGGMKPFFPLFAARNVWHRDLVSTAIAKEHKFHSAHILLFAA